MAAPTRRDCGTIGSSLSHADTSTQCNPVLVGTNNHAFILCGYRRTNHPQPGWIEFIRHDDQAGPYLVSTTSSMT